MMMMTTKLWLPLLLLGRLETVHATTSPSKQQPLSKDGEGCSRDNSINNNNNNMDTEWGQALSSQELERKRSATTPSPVVVVAEEVDIAIVGGGLVGLAVALGLSRNGNRKKIRVYERAPQLRSVSQGILCVQPNGMAALESLHPDLPKRVEAMGCRRNLVRHVQIRPTGSSGSATTTTVTESIHDNLVKQVQQNYGRYKVGITWHNMQQVLASLVQEESQDENIVQTGYSFVSFEEEDEAVLLHFANGRTVRAQAVIACDGVFSVARRQLVAGDDHPIYFGQLNWGTVIETAQLPPHVRPPKEAVQFFAYNPHNNNAEEEENPADTKDPIPRWMSMVNDGGNGYTFWQFRVSDPTKALALSGSRGRGGLGLPGVKAALLRVLQNSSADIADVLRAIDNAQIFERSIVGRRPLVGQSWRSSNGRLALCGDAAHGMHPNIGQGANTAFGSAAAVVRALLRHSGDWKRALREYEATRKPVMDLIQGFANAMGVWQATGNNTNLLSPQAQEAMLDWILRNDSNAKPPAEVVEFLKHFDPLEQPGISLLS